MQTPGVSGAQQLHELLSHRLDLTLEKQSDAINSPNNGLSSTVPPVIRVPGLLWARLKYELSDWLVKSGVDNVMTVSWREEAFARVAVRR
ncbi:unnamed protein product [Protopolystoma xenopodis]|uniref:Uncharacterized protein n=1 Tax=Protopolystoma xenopodis TaxID=117903 RepID=A0A448XL87_9PLAT|nr:unnamed protein product [Protopolystoma xenopodis]